MSARVYLISSPGRVRLIKASTPAQAIRFAVGTDYQAQVASQDDLITNLQACPVEDATKTPEPEPAATE